MNEGIPEDLSEEIRAAFAVAAKHPPFLVGEDAEPLLEFIRTHPATALIAPLLMQAMQDWILLSTRLAAIYGMLGIDLSKAPAPTPFVKKLFKLDESDSSH